MQSVVRHGYDGLLVIRAPGSAALTADTTLAKISIDRITKGPLINHYGSFEFSLLVHFEAGLLAGTDNVYTLNFVSYDAAGLNPVTHMSTPVVVGDLGKTMVYSFDLQTIQKMDADAALFSVAFDAAGATPSVAFWAFITAVAAGQ